MAATSLLTAVSSRGSQARLHPQLRSQKSSRSPHLPHPGHDLLTARSGFSSVTGNWNRADSPRFPGSGQAAGTWRVGRCQPAAVPETWRQPERESSSSGACGCCAPEHVSVDPGADDPGLISDRPTQLSGNMPAVLRSGDRARGCVADKLGCCRPRTTF